MDDFGKWFRKVFSLPPPHSRQGQEDNFPQGPQQWNYKHSRIDTDADENILDDFQERGNAHSDVDRMFDHFHGNIWRHMESLHRQMEDMMKGFGAMDFPSEFNSPPGRELPPVDEDLEGPQPDGGIWFGTPSPFFHFGERSPQQKSPRDFMLKDDEPAQLPCPPPPHPGQENPRSHPFFSPSGRWGLRRREERKDSDLDGQLDDKQVVDMITKQPQQPQEFPRAAPGPRMSSWGKSVSITRVQGPDGRVEERRVVKDSSGRQESSVTKSVGGQSHTLTTITGQDGTTETSETLKNMDEKDIDQFQSQWKSPHRPSSPADSLMPHPDVDCQDRDLFSKLFGWNK